MAKRFKKNRDFFLQMYSSMVYAAILFPLLIVTILFCILSMTILFCILSMTILFSFVWFGKRGWQSNKKSLKHLLEALLFQRCVRDSNSWPHAWQACILTYWTNAPNVCIVFLCPSFMAWERACFFAVGGAYETRTRDPMRDRHVF